MANNGFVGAVKIPTKMKKPNSKTNSSPHSQTKIVTNIPTQVISHTPGRLRLRVSHSDRVYLQDLQQTLLNHPEIADVRTNTNQGSITIYHRFPSSQLTEVMGILEDFGIILGDIFNIGTGRTIAAETVTSTIIDLNRRIKRSTNGEFDLRVLFPLGLACLSVRQLLIKGLQLEIIPWYVLAWYAFDSFLKLHTASLPEEG